MKKAAAIIVAVSFYFAAIAISAAFTQPQGKVVHEAVVQGVRAVFSMINIREALKGMQLPEGMKDTHHFKVVLTDAVKGTPFIEGVVTVKVLGPAR